MLTNFRTFQISVKFYKECNKIKLPRHLKDQLNRSSSSISLNPHVSGGIGVNQLLLNVNTWSILQRKFFHIAMGSLRESQAVLILSNLENSNIYNITDHLAASLYKLINAKPPN